jgi:hypothetical protein
LCGEAWEIANGEEGFNVPARHRLMIYGLIIFRRAVIHAAAFDQTIFAA